MSAKCTKELILDSITELANAKSQTEEKATVFNSTVNNLVDYFKELDIPYDELNIPAPKPGVFSPFIRKIREVLSEGNQLFLVKKDGLESSTFLEPSIYNDSQQLINLLVEAGISKGLAIQIDTSFRKFNTTTSANLESTNGVFFNSFMPLLYGARKVEGQETTYQLPRPIIFSAAVTLIRWIATDGTRTLNAFTDKQIESIVNYDASDVIPEEVYDAFRELEHGGIITGEAALSLGKMIYKSLNIKTNIGETSSDLDLILAHHLGTFALEMGVLMGIVKKGEVIYKDKHGEPAYFPHFFTSEESIKDTGVHLKAVVGYSDVLDKFFGVNQSFNAPSTTPFKGLTHVVQGALGEISPHAKQVGDKLSKTEWTVIDAYHLYMVGADTDNVQLKIKANRLRKVLAGYTFLKENSDFSEEDADYTQIDLLDGIKAKNRQILDQIKVIKKYSDTGLINSFYLKWKFMAQHRMMIVGELNPHDSKIVRFLVRPASTSRVEIDPSKKDSKLLKAFKIAVAQHFDLSVDKTDVQGSLELFNKVFEDFEDNESALSQAVSAVIELGNTPSDVAEENFVDAMLELHKKYSGANTALIMAVNALAQYKNSLDTDTAFKTDIVAEADAVTSGFAIGLLLFTSNIIDDMKKELNRVGVTFEGDAPYSERVKNGKIYPDGYLNFANALFDKFDSFEEYLGTQKEPEISQNYRKKLKHSYDAFNILYAPLVTNRRNAGKPPFMVLNYEGKAPKVSREAAISLVDSLFKHIGSLQQKYDNAKTDIARIQIVNEGIDIMSAIESQTYIADKYGKSYLFSFMSPVEVKSHLEAGNLHEQSFNRSLDARRFTQTFKETLVNSLTTTLIPAISTAHVETGIGTHIKNTFSKAVELQYFFFIHRYLKLLDEVEGRTEGKLLPAQRKMLAMRLIDVYPRIALKHQDGATSFIDLVKSMRIASSTSYEIPLKGKNKSISMLSHTFAPPGASGVVRTIQGVDATLIQDSISIPNIERSDIPVLPIHDAKLEQIANLFKTKDIYNLKFPELLNPEFDVFKQVADRLKETWDDFTEEEKNALNFQYLANSFENKKAEAENKELPSAVLNNVLSISQQVTENRAALALEMKNAIIEHSYFPDVGLTENENYADRIEMVKQSLENNKKDYQRSSHYLLIKGNESLFKAVSARLKKLYPNVRVNSYSTLVDQFGHEVLGNAIGTAINYSSSKGALDTVPHEYAHVYLNLLEHTSVIGNQIKKIKKIHNVDSREAKEILAAEMGRRFTDKVLGLKGKQTQTIAQRIWSFIREIFKSLYQTVDQLEAEWIYQDLHMKFSKGVSRDTITNKPKEGMELQEFDTILENNPWGAEIIKTVLTEMLPEAMLVGSLALTAFGNIYRKGVGTLHDIDFAIPYASFNPNRGLKGNIKAFFPNAEEIYEFNIGFTSDGKPAKYIRLVIPPPGTKISNLQRFEQDKNGRIISWNVVDENNPSNIVGTYVANTVKDPAAPAWSVKSIIESEKVTGKKAVLVDFLTDVRNSSPETIYSTYLGSLVKVAHPSETFISKTRLADKNNVPRSKDVIDFNLFKPGKDGITPPDLFKSVDKGSSFNKLLETSTTWHNNAPVTLSAIKIFNDLGASDVDYDPVHASHLERILQTIILDHIQNVDDVVVQTALIKEESRGGFKEALRKVVVQLNENSPITYAEQGPQEIYVHELLHAVFDNVLKNNKELQSELDQLHKEAIKHITVEDFLIGGTKSNKAAERAVAQKQYEYVYKNSTEFLIYALTNKGLVKRMQDVAPKRPEKLWKGERFIDRIINLIEYITNKFNTEIRHKKLTSSQYADFYNFGLKVVTINDRHNKSIAILARQFQINALAEKGMDAVVNSLTSAISKTGEVIFKDTALGETISRIKGLPPQIKKAATEKAFLKVFAALTDREQIKVLALFVKDLVVGTGSVKIQTLLLKAKGLHESGRIRRAKFMVKYLRDHTKTKVAFTPKYHTALTKTVIKTDLSALMSEGGMAVIDIIKLIEHPALLAQRIRDYELMAGTVNNVFYRIQTNELARFMITTESSGALQALNATRMYRLHQKFYDLNFIKDAEIIKHLDVLVSLLALQKVPANIKALALEMIKAEFAVDKVDNLVISLIEQHKVNKRAALEHNFQGDPLKMIKGYTRSSTNSNVEIVTAPLKDKEKLRKEGFILEEALPDIPGISQAKMGLYINMYNPESTRTTGVLPYTGEKAKGTTLFSILAKNPIYQRKDPDSGDMVGDPALIRPVIAKYTAKQIELLNNQIITNNVGKGVRLIPLFDAGNEIYDFRVMMSTHLQEKLLKPDMTYEHVMSKLEMHYIDRKSSTIIEKESIEYLVDVVNKEYKGIHDKNFINLLDKKHIERFFMFLPRTFRDRVKENAIPTDNGLVFPIKKEELHILVGSKDMSVRDLPYFIDFPYPIRKWTLKAENLLEGLVKVAITNIIFKIPQVILDNIYSNSIILVLNGVNPVEAIAGQMRALKHLREWKNTTAEMIDLYYQYHAKDGKDKKLLLRFKALQASLQNSPIFELMDKHLFTSMVEEIHLNENSSIDRWAREIEEKAGKFIPRTIMKIVKYSYMTKSTAPFQAIQEVFQASDFVARVVLNAHFRKIGMSDEERLRTIYDTFALYDVPGTSRLANYLNKTGILFFLKYWSKIQRSIISTAKRQTKSVIFLLGMQSATDVDVPDIFDSSILTGNFAPPISNPAEVLENVIGLHGITFAEDLLKF